MDDIVQALPHQMYGDQLLKVFYEEVRDFSLTLFVIFHILVQEGVRHLKEAWEEAKDHATSNGMKKYRHNTKGQEDSIV